MGIKLGDNINITAGLPNDCRYQNAAVGPYTGVSEANTIVTSDIRYTGLTVNILGTEYWYKNGITDPDLVEKTTGDGGSGLLNWTGSTANAIGTYISPSGICAQPNLTFDGSILTVSGIACATTCFAGSGAGLTNINASCLNGNLSTSYLRSDVADSKTTGNLVFSDNICASFGTGSDMGIYHSGSHGYIYNTVGSLYIGHGSSEKSLVSTPNSCLSLYFDDSEKIKTVTDGVCVLGITYTSTCFVGDGSGLTNLPSSGGVLNWTGSTANAIGTYISPSGICAQPNLTFDGSILTAPAFRTSGTADYSLITRSGGSSALYVQQIDATGLIADFRYNSGSAGGGSSAMQITNVGIQVYGSGTFDGNLSGRDYVQVLDTGGSEGFKMQWNDTEKSIDFIIN